MDDATAERLTIEAADKVIGNVRRAAKELTGGNWTFVDDDLRQIVGLAKRACEAGLTHGMAPDVQAKIKTIHQTPE